MKKIFIASKNKGKIKEITSCLDGLGIEFLSLIGRPEIPDIEETGKTFRDNALIKAKAVYDIVKIPVLADDSGLEVDSLKGEPGIYSARFAGENAADADNCEKLLAELNDIEQNKRQAGFKCVLALYDGSSEKYFEGVCRGEIVNAMRGSQGFGYDPLFLPEGYDKTFAELDVETKNEISHRGKALKNLLDYLQQN